MRPRLLNVVPSMASVFSITAMSRSATVPPEIESPSVAFVAGVEPVDEADFVPRETLTADGRPVTPFIVPVPVIFRLFSSAAAARVRSVRSIVIPASDSEADVTAMSRPVTSPDVITSPVVAAADAEAVDPRVAVTVPVSPVMLLTIVEPVTVRTGAVGTTSWSTRRFLSETCAPAIARPLAMSVPLNVMSARVNCPPLITSPRAPSVTGRYNDFPATATSSFAAPEIWKASDPMS